MSELKDTHNRRKGSCPGRRELKTDQRGSQQKGSSYRAIASVITIMKTYCDLGTVFVCDLVKHTSYFLCP